MKNTIKTLMLIGGFLQGGIVMGDDAQEKFQIISGGALAPATYLIEVTGSTTCNGKEAADVNGVIFECSLNKNEINNVSILISSDKSKNAKCKLHFTEGKLYSGLLNAACTDLRVQVSDAYTVNMQ